MESFKERPRKRKQSTSDPFEGTFTRSKSLIYTHQNRSGRARSDTIRQRPHHEVDHHFLTRSRKKRVGFYGRNSNNDNHHSHDMSLLSIKDLRARRVFSHPLDTDLGESKVLDGTNGDWYKEKSEPELDSECSGENGKREEVDCNLEGLCDGNPNLSIPEIDVSEAENQRSGLEEDVKSNDGDSRDFQNLKDTSPISKENVVASADFCAQKCEEPIEEIVQTTPPDSVISIERKVNADGSSNDGISLKKSSSIERPPSQIYPNYDAGSAKNISANAVVRNDSNSRRRPVLNRCSGLKVYKTPSSFSYKRLLPYLMEIAKDKSRAVELESSHKTEIAANGKVSEKLHDSVPKETPVGRPNFDVKIEIASSEMLSDKPQDSLLRETPNFHAKSEIDANEIISEKSQDFPLKETSFGSPNFDVKTVGPVLPSTSEETPKSEYEEDRHATDSSTQMTLMPIPTHCSSDNSPDKLLSSPKASQPGVLAIEQDVSPVVPVSSDILIGSSNEKDGRLSLHSCRDAASSPTVGLAKGILKRNPRGCRGLCDCLDCVSFRLHAERAFEFSTNQMKDAEEVALDLMREVSQLRSLLEKSVGANNSSNVSVDEVKEACAKASSAEECARTHLRQMNEDLYVHCRTKSLQRPRVNFASCVLDKFVEKCPSARKGEASNRNI